MTKTLDPKKTIFLIDGSGFLYRAYYGLKPLHTPQGLPVQAVYSFCRMIKKLMDTFHPQNMALVWDSKGKTKRHELYPEYKATRQAPPSDLFQQKQLIQEFANHIGLKQIELQGAEADDLMYAVAQDFKNTDNTIVLVTSDKDMRQTIADNIIIFDPFKDIFIDAETFKEKMGFPVEKLPFYFALVGDSSDNIPGVKGIGEKGATELVQQFESLEDVYNNLDKVSKERTRKALQENKDNAFLSEKLFLLQYYDTHTTQKDLQFDAANWANAAPLFRELDFKSLLKTVVQEEHAIQEEKPTLSESKGYIFHTITTVEDLTTLCSLIQQKKIVAVDIEGSGLNPLEDELVGICLCVESGTAYYVPCAHHTVEQQLSRDIVIATLKPLLEDKNIKKVMHHSKFDQLALLHQHVSTQNLIFDTLVAAHLVTEDWQRIGLKALSQHYLHETMLSYEDVVKKNHYKNFSYVPLDLATEYGASDAHQTIRLWPILQAELEKQHMEALYRDIEHPLINVLLKMEAEGIYLDREVLKSLDAQVSVDLAKLKSDIISLIGPDQQDINLNSPKQLEALLFQHLKLPPQKKSSKRTGYSTDVEVLQELAKIHPVPGLILKYRELFKLKSTYIDALPTYINKYTGKIHTNFSQTAVATGRLASSNPNLQNIPVEAEDYDVHIRSAFKPAPGHIFLSADYSQIELRVLAELSQDKNLIQAFLENRDIHAQTASKLFDVPIDQVTSDQRQIGKRINFSILYGLTPYGLSKDLGIPFKDAKTYIEKYFAQYPAVSTWMENTIEETKTHGFVTTYWGRRRYVPGIYEKNKMLYDLARRIAINTKAQGTAAEIMKLGMIKLDHALAEKKLGAKIILQIHDELILSVPFEQQKQTEHLVKQILENVVSWSIPLVVTTRFGKDWQEVTK